MKENTDTAPSSSLPAFMQNYTAEQQQAVDGGEDTPEQPDPSDAIEKAKRREERERLAQDRDAFDIRTAALAKATGKIGELTTYLHRIDAVVEKTIPEFIAVHPLGQVLDKFVDLEDQVLLLEKAFDAVKGRLTLSREVLIPQRMDDEETKTTTSSETGHRITRVSKIFASILPGLTDKAFEWLRSHEYGSLIKETVNSSSLSGAAKEMIENGRELPDDLFRTHEKDSVSITRKKGKAK